MKNILFAKMKLKTFKPTTPSSRNLIRLNNIDLQNSPLLKNQIKAQKIPQEKILREELQLTTGVADIRNGTEK